MQVVKAKETDELKLEIEKLKRELEMLKSTSSVLEGNDWMNIGAGIEECDLWIFVNNQPRKIASLTRGKMLILGTPKI
ncbi:hypothetical protein H6G33_10345 [Calothrix sp. FACHB-1219]|uniref:hypothetical protein n=1 Tax=unclassified Calothrix TaxID=2619626 RepID=UPI00168A3262|nr:MULTISPECIES: hypothetical protein [unclassified Calothrix]MBD2201746.1 hypothetical protein [Calothrix sp. FACHB-168]MBD2217432.1 hypothetical protein [Calothrix sp. FACHB-1219]